LRISVENSASGRATEARVTGVGLQNVRRRLEICYGAGAELRFSPGMEFTTAEIRIPLAPAGGAARSTYDGAQPGTT
jgi:LytS/YehU family sensor histidine kinase